MSDSSDWNMTDDININQVRSLHARRASNGRNLPPLRIHTESSTTASDSQLISHLIQYRRRHLINAAAHATASRYKNRNHKILGIITAVVTCIGMIVQYVMGRYAPEWATLVGNINLAIVGALGAITTVLNLGRETEKHLVMRDINNNIVDLIDTGLAVGKKKQNPDYSRLLAEIQAEWASLRKISINIPDWILKRMTEAYMEEGSVDGAIVAAGELG